MNTRSRAKERYKARLRAQGRCTNCGKPNDDGFIRCSACRARQAARKREKYHKNPDQKKKSALRYYYANRDEIREKERAKKAATCRNCGVVGRSLSSTKRCDDCALLYRLERAARLNAQLVRQQEKRKCRLCDAPREKEKQFCESCRERRWNESRARRRAKERGVPRLKKEIGLPEAKPAETEIVNAS